MPPTIPFADPDPFQELRYSSVLAGKLAIADYLGRPLAKLSAEDRGYINALLEETLDRRTVITCVRDTSATAPISKRPISGREKASMRAEVMEFYGLTRSPHAVGYYETAHHRQLLQNIKQAVYDGDLAALCGVVGSGKTVTLRRLQKLLARENRVIVLRPVAGQGTEDPQTGRNA